MVAVCDEFVGCSASQCSMHADVIGRQSKSWPLPRTCSTDSGNSLSLSLCLHCGFLTRSNTHILAMYTQQRASKYSNHMPHFFALKNTAAAHTVVCLCVCVCVCVASCCRPLHIFTRRECSRREWSAGASMKSASTKDVPLCGYAPKSHTERGSCSLAKPLCTSGTPRKAIRFLHQIP